MTNYDDQWQAILRLHDPNLRDRNRTSTGSGVMHSASSLQVGDYAETDRHYGRIIFKYDEEVCEFERIECLHGSQKMGCSRPYESIFFTQLKAAPSPEELVVQALGDDYL